jgi:hypothetical protein
MVPTVCTLAYEGLRDGFNGCVPSLSAHVPLLPWRSVAQAARGPLWRQLAAELVWYIGVTLVTLVFLDLYKNLPGSSAEC